MGWPGCGPPGGWCPAAPGGMAPMGGATVLGGGPPPLDMGGGGGPAAAGSPGVVPGAPGAGGAMKEVDMTLWLATRPGEGDTASVLTPFFPNCLIFLFCVILSACSFPSLLPVCLCAFPLFPPASLCHFGPFPPAFLAFPACGGSFGGGRFEFGAGKTKWIS